MMTREYSIHEKQAPDAISRPRGNGHAGYIDYCPHCGDCSTLNDSHVSLATRGYYQQTLLMRCGKCGDKYTRYG